MHRLDGLLSTPQRRCAMTSPSSIAQSAASGLSAQRYVAGLGALRRLLRRHAKAALLGGAEADLAHPITNDAPSVSRATRQEVAHFGAAVLHKHAVGEAADRGRDTDRPGADKVAVVVPLLDPEKC